ncbi:MAG TPA: ABC transporter permease [Candidatus Nitrosotalea sp.]|nr:ABC transporter permease [Candidatus Nitrosotalea sp.]
MSPLLRAGLRAFEVSLKNRVVSPWTYLNWIAFPLILASVGLFVFSHSSTPGHDAYAALGGGLIGFWTSAYLDGGNSIGSERWEGTLEALLAVPTPIWVVMVGKITAALLLGVISFIPALALAYLGFRIAPLQIDAGPFLVSFLVLTFSFFAIAMAFAPLFALWRWAFSLTNGFELGVYVLGGFMFPVDRLELWLQRAAWFVPPSWATRALYHAAGQAGRADYAGWWARSIALSLVCLLLSRLLFRLVEQNARRTGQLATA